MWCPKIRSTFILCARKSYDASGTCRKFPSCEDAKARWPGMDEWHERAQELSETIKTFKGLGKLGATLPRNMGRAVSLFDTWNAGKSAPVWTINSWTNLDSKRMAVKMWDKFVQTPEASRAPLVVGNKWHYFVCSNVCRKKKSSRGKYRYVYKGGCNTGYGSASMEQRDITKINFAASFQRA